MNCNIPGYLEGIQDDLKTIIYAAERAADYIENGPTYQKNTHPFHAAAVSTYNRLVSVIIEMEKFQVKEENRNE